MPAPTAAPKLPAEVLNAYLDENDTRLVLVHRDERGHRRQTKLKAEWASFYAKNDLSEKLLRDLKSSAYVSSVRADVEFVRVTWKGEHARRDFTSDPRSPLVQADIKTYEGDVDPIRRFLSDHTVRVATPRLCYLDIETDSRVPFSRKTEMRVLSWALVDAAGDAQLGVLEADTDEAERALLIAFWAALESFDQVLAWNGDNFDFPVLFARSEHCGVECDARKWLWLDHLALFKRMNMHSAESGDEKQSMKLEDIAQAVVGEGKEATPEWIKKRFGDKSLGALAWQLWDGGIECRRFLVKYNLRDTDLLRRIEKETGYAALFATLCEVCNIFGDSAGLNPTHQVDGFMLKLGRERGHRFPTRKFRESIEQFKGAYVMEPETEGIERNVHVCDFASLYPSIILSFNMSPDTKRSVPVNGPIPINHCRAPTTGVGFATDVVGILTLALREILRLRKYWNDKKAAAVPGTPEWVDADRRSNAYKVAANSFYGVVGSAFSRYFDPQVAESVTTTGVWLLKAVIAAAIARGWKAIYGDTDSAFVKGCTEEEFRIFVEWCNKELFPKMIAGQGCIENNIKLAYEKEFARIIFTSAKRYCGVYSHYKGTRATVDSKPEIKGLEYKRGDASRMARQLQGHVIDLLCGGLKIDNGSTPTEELDRYHQIVSELREHVLKDPLTHAEVVMSKSLSRPLREYVSKPKKDGTKASLPSHVQMAHVMKERGQEVGEGTRVEYVVTDGDVSPHKVMLAEDYTGSEIDRHYIWESLVFPPSLRLLRAAFPKADWERWARSRPPKLRGRKVKVLEGQAELGIDKPAPALPGRAAKPYEFRIDEAAVYEAGGMRALQRVLAAHPGTRRCSVIIVLTDGSTALLDLPMTVAGGKDLDEALAEFRSPAA